MALSTPNEGLISILMVFVIIFVESPLTLYLFTSILDMKTSKKQKITYISLLSITACLSTLVIHLPFNTIFNYVVNFFLIFLIFKINILKTLVAITIPSITFAIIGSLILNPFLTILHIQSHELDVIPIYRISYILITYILVFGLTMILKIKNLKLNLIDDFDKKSNIILISNLILGFFTLGIQIIITAYYTDTLPIIITFLNFISLLSYFFISIYGLTRATKLIITTKELESAEQYNKTLHILHDNVRGFKHDFDNIVTTIGGYINTNDMSGLKKYYIELEDDCERVNNLYILNPDVVNNPGIYNLLTTKYHEAEDKGIKIKLSFFVNLTELNIKIYEFARILGILLDNAIEASSECPQDKKIINIIFRKEVKKHRNIIIIENTYTNKEVDISKIFQKGISEKENHSGIRIMGSKKIIKQK